MNVAIQPVPEQPGFVVLHFSNDGNDPVWLVRPRAMLDPDQPVDGPFLEFEPHRNYKGTMVKRVPYTVDEMLCLEPGEAVSSPPLRLTDYYEMPSSGLVRARYEAWHPLTSPDAFGELVASEWVTIDV